MDLGGVAGPRASGTREEGGVAVLARLGGTRFGVWTVRHVFSPLDRWFYRRTGGRRTSTGRPIGPILLLTHTGRRSGREHTTPVFYLRDGARLVICNVHPHYERANPWTLNIRAQPLVRAQVGREMGTYHAREATEAEVERYWPSLVAIWPPYQTHLDGGGTRSVFVLEPERT
jgi:deazaflavin-dependent oxidoreductase (nitroreductase family)